MAQTVSLVMIVQHTMLLRNGGEKNTLILSVKMSSLLTELARTYALSSLWFTYSMLKFTINAYNHIDISKYNRFQAFLKKQQAGYQAKKSKVFTKQDISKFLSLAPDAVHLSEKVKKLVRI